MKNLLNILIVAVCLPYLVLSQLNCHRCYGNSYCNDASHTDFVTNIRNSSCNVAVDFEIKNPILKQIQTAINANFLTDLEDQASTQNFTTEGQCITATVHEAHDSHTLRSCVTRNVATGSNVTLCEVLHAIIQPLNEHNGTFTCRSCNGTHFCNNHTLLIGDGIAPPSEPSAAVTISAPLGFIAALVTLYQLF